jgi:tetratricopeptide (TPR) repeat protein
MGIMISLGDASLFDALAQTPLELIGALAVVGIIMVAALLGDAILLAYFQRSRRGAWYRVTPQPPTARRLPTWVDAERADQVAHAIADLEKVAWGQNATTDPAQTARLFARGTAILDGAAGDEHKMPEAVVAFAQCAEPLAYVGAARVLGALSYVNTVRQGRASKPRSVPAGIWAGLNFTDRALAADPHLPDAWIQRANLLAAYPTFLNRFLMRLALDRARQLTPQDPELLRVTAKVAGVLGQTRRQIAALRRASELAPTEEFRKTTLNQLALTLGYAGKTTAALATFARLHADFPDFAWGWHNAANLLYRRGDCAAALTAVDRALSLTDFPEARLLQARIHAKLKAQPAAEQPAGNAAGELITP